jgi:hypothetical protein
MGPTRAVCRAGHCAAVATDDAGLPVTISNERRCLPAMICDSWSDCATVVGNVQDGYFVEQAHAAPRGSLASIADVYTTGPKYEAARLFLPAKVCPPWTAPPLIEPPKYACALENGVCRATPKP